MILQVIHWSNLVLDQSAVPANLDLVTVRKNTGKYKLWIFLNNLENHNTPFRPLDPPRKAIQTTRNFLSFFYIEP